MRIQILLLIIFYAATCMCYINPPLRRFCAPVRNLAENVPSDVNNAQVQIAPSSETKPSALIRIGQRFGMIVQRIVQAPKSFLVGAGLLTGALAMVELLKIVLLFGVPIYFMFGNLILSSPLHFELFSFCRVHEVYV